MLSSPGPQFSSEPQSEGRKKPEFLDHQEPERACLLAPPRSDSADGSFSAPPHDVPTPRPDESIHLSLKSRCGGLVIKMWRAAAQASARRRAPRLLVSFNQRMETLRPTQGSLTTAQLHPRIYFLSAP